MGGGSGPQQPTQTTTQVLSPQQQELMSLAMPSLRQYAATVPQRYDQPTVADFNPTQTTAQQTALGAAGQQANVANNAASAVQNLTSGNIWDPNFNPNLRGAIDAATRPIVDQFTQQIAPAIRSGAVATGGFGGSRQGINETRGAEATARAVGDTSSKLVEDLYKTNLDAQLKAVGLTPTVQAGQLQPAMTAYGVGSDQQAMEQAKINAAVQGFNFDQAAPFMAGRDIISMLAGMPGGSTTSTANVPQVNPWMQSLGGAAAGAAAGSAFGPVGTGIGAVGGGVLPWIFR